MITDVVTTGARGCTDGASTNTSSSAGTGTSGSGGADSRDVARGAAPRPGNPGGVADMYGAKDPHAGAPSRSDCGESCALLRDNGDGGSGPARNGVCSGCGDTAPDAVAGHMPDVELQARCKASRPCNAPVLGVRLPPVLQAEKGPCGAGAITAATADSAAVAGSSCAGTHTSRQESTSVLSGTSASAGPTSITRARRGDGAADSGDNRLALPWRCMVDMRMDVMSCSTMGPQDVGWEVVGDALSGSPVVMVLKLSSLGRDTACIGSW